VWGESSRLEAGLDVRLCEYCWPDPCICYKEVYLVNIVDILASQLLDIMAIVTIIRERENKVAGHR
jgi:hypothetical protein